MQTTRVKKIHNQYRFQKLKHRLSLLFWLRFTCVCAIVLSIVFLIFVRPARIHGNSMYPSLEHGDIVLNNVLFSYIKKIERFDVVEVYDSKKEKSYFKRVVGLPGEVIQYRDDKLYVNGEVKDEYFLDDGYRNESENYGPIKLKGDEYFVCGDNRKASYDSRHYGPILEDDIISVSFFRIFH